MSQTDFRLLEVSAKWLFLRFVFSVSTLALGRRRRGVGERNEGSSLSIIISHAVVRECIPGRGRGLTETSVDSMLFPLITFIIGFKVSRPLVKSMPSVSLVRRTYDSTGTFDTRTRRRNHTENLILILLNRTNHSECSAALPSRLVFHYFSFHRREKNEHPHRCIKERLNWMSGTITSNFGWSEMASIDTWRKNCSKLVIIYMHENPLRIYKLQMYIQKKNLNFGSNVLMFWYLYIYKVEISALSI